MDHGDSPTISLLYATLAISGAFAPSGDGWGDVLGWTIDELANATFLEWVHPDDRDAVITAIHAVYAGGAVLSFAARFSAKYGDYTWLHWTIAPHTRQVELELIGRPIPSL